MSSGISGIGSSTFSNLTSILQALRNSGTAEASGTSASSAQATNAQGDTKSGVDISQLSSFLSKLEDLKNTNPDKYKQILSDFADKLRDLAKQIAAGGNGATNSDGSPSSDTSTAATSTAAASVAGTTGTTTAATTATAGSSSTDSLVQTLNDMAARFDTAAQTGDVSQLLPQSPQPPASQQASGASGSGYGQYHHHHHHHGGGAAGAASANSGAVSQLQTMFEQLTQEVAAA